MPINIRSDMRLVSTLLVLVCGICACSQLRGWPPNWDGVVHEFNSHESELLALSEAMREDGLSSVVRQDTNEIQYVTPTRLDSRLRRKYRELFEAAGPSIWAVFQRDSHTRFQVELPHDRDLYARLDLERGNQTDDAVKCDRSLRTRPCGYCSAPLRDNWTLSYFWIRGELGRTDFEEGRDLPSEELNRRREEATQMCLAEFRDSMTSD